MGGAGACRRRPAPRGGAFAEISLCRRSDPAASLRPARRPRRRAHRPLHQSTDRRRGNAGARLLCDAASSQRADAAAALHIQRNLPGRVRLRPLADRRTQFRMVAARRVQHPALDLGEPRSARLRRRSFYRLRQIGLRAARPVARGTAIDAAVKANDGIGASVRRVEDARLLRGAGRFVADIVIPGELHSAIVRSPHAHATIRKIDTARAAAAPGVVAVFSGTDMAADHVGPMLALWAIRGADGKPMAEPPRWALARERVRHVGEPVAVVIAQTREQALDAAELVEVDYETLAAVVDARAAAGAQAPQLHDAAPENICFRWARGDEAAVRQAVQSAAHVTRLDLINNRLIGAAIEPRAVLAVADAASERLTLYTSTQVPHHIRRYVAEQLGLAEGSIRVVAPDVGGAFGYKGKH